MSRFISPYDRDFEKVNEIEQEAFNRGYKIGKEKALEELKKGEAGDNDLIQKVDATPREHIEKMIAEIENFPTLNIGEKAFKAVCLTIIQEYTKEQK